MSEEEEIEKDVQFRRMDGVSTELRLLLYPVTRVCVGESELTSCRERETNLLNFMEIFQYINLLQHVYNTWT